MAITTAITASFKVEMLSALHDFTGTHTYKVALIKASPSGSYGSSTTNYSTVTGNSDEVASGGGYTTGGQTLTPVTPASTGSIAYTNFASVSWTSATFNTSGCIIYNTSASNKAVAVFDFGGNLSVTGGTFQLVMPASDSTHALIRIN